MSPITHTLARLFIVYFAARENSNVFRAGSPRRHADAVWTRFTVSSAAVITVYTHRHSALSRLHYSRANENRSSVFFCAAVSRVNVIPLLV